MDQFRIYLSSPYEDLIHHRRLIIEALTARGYKVVAMEDYLATSARTIDRCLKDVRSCELYIGLLAHRYGECPHGFEKSFTELEFEEALNNDIPTLCFLLHEEDSISRKYDDILRGLPDCGENIRKFRNRFKDRSAAFFRVDPHSVFEPVVSAVKKHIEDHESVTTEQSLNDSLVASKEQQSVSVGLDPLARYLQSLTHPLQKRTFGIDEFYVPLANQADDSRQFLDMPEFDVLSVNGSNKKLELEDIDSAVELHTHCVLVGAPGAGKTSALKQLELTAARKALSTAWAKIPLYIRLADWPRNIESFEDFIVFEQQRKGLSFVPINHLLLLLDGLNEIDSSAYENRLAQISQWLNQQRDVKAVFTTRDRHFNNAENQLYYGDDSRLRIAVVQIHPLDDVKIQRFVRAYFAQESTTADRFLSQLWGENLKGDETKRLWNLARNPLQLLILCVIFGKNEENLPLNRAALFEDFFRVLYVRELKKPNHREILFDELVNRLGSLALEMFKSKESTVVHSDFTRKRLVCFEDTADLSTQMGVLIFEREDTLVSFGHPLYQDYLAARFLVHHSDQLDGFLNASGFYQKSFEAGAKEIDEIFFLMLDMAPKLRDDLCGKLQEAAPILAHDLASYVPSEDFNDSGVIDNLLKSISNSSPAKRREIIDRIKKLDKRGLHRIDCLIDGKDKKLNRELVPVLAEIGGMEGFSRLVRMLRESKNVRRDAEEELFDFIESQPDILRQYAVNLLPKNPPSLRDRYARSLLNLFDTFKFNEDPGKSPYLTKDQRDCLQLDVATAGGDPVLLEWVFSRRLPIPKNPPNHNKSHLKQLTPAQLVSRLAENSSNSARAYIDALVAKGEVSLPPLLDALAAESAMVVRRACRALGLIGDRIAVPGLIHTCERSDNANVRLNAVRALGKIGDLYGRKCIVNVLHDEKPEVRVTATRALSKICARYGFEESDIRIFEALVNDPEPEVAIHALGALKVYDSAKFETTDLFRRLWDDALELANSTQAFKAANALAVVAKFERELALKIALRRVYSTDRVFREEMLDFLEDIGFIAEARNEDQPVGWKLWMIQHLASLSDEDNTKRLRTFLFSREYQVRLEVLCQKTLNVPTFDLTDLFEIAEFHDPNPAVKAAARHLKELGKESTHLQKELEVPEQETDCYSANFGGEWG